jgi:hypothetical protein
MEVTRIQSIHELRYHTQENFAGTWSLETGRAAPANASQEHIENNARGEEDGCIYYSEIEVDNSEYCLDIGGTYDAGACLETRRSHDCD